MDGLFGITESVSVDTVLTTKVALIVVAANVSLSINSAVTIDNYITILTTQTKLGPVLTIVLNVFVNTIVNLVGNILITCYGLTTFVIALNAVAFVQKLTCAVANNLPVISGGLSFQTVKGKCVFGVPVPFVVVVVICLIV